jgi:hypothetical protein
MLGLLQIMIYFYFAYAQCIDHLPFILQDDYPGSLHLSFLSAAQFDQLGVSGSMQLFADRLQVCGLCEFIDLQFLRSTYCSPWFSLSHAVM